MNSAFDIALSGMRASQTAVQVTGHNIANANTDGYTRQRANFAANAFKATNATVVNGGVRLTGVQRLSDRWVVRHIQEQLAQKGYYSSMSTRLGEVEAVLNDLDDSGLGSAISTFFSSLSDLSDTPESNGVRINTIQAGAMLAARLRNARSQLETIGREGRLELDHEVSVVNDTLDQIAKLNAQVKRGMAMEENVSGLIDQREQLLAQVSSKISARVFITADETEASVSVDGVALVLGANASHLEVNSSGIFVQGTTSQLSYMDGELGAMLQVRDDVLPRYMQNLDDLAGAFITEFNNVHRTGFGLDGSTGLDFFTGTDARDIGVNSALVADPQKLAASATGAAGDNGTAKALSSLRDAATIGGLTFDEFHQSMIGNIGAETMAADNQSSSFQNILDQLYERRDSVHGVSLDEEMANLMMFQQGYAASAKMISMVDEMIQTLLAIGR